MDIRRFVSVLLVFAVLLCGGCVISVPGDNTPPVSDEPDILEVHFIDVGQGESTLVMCGGEAMLVDGGTSESSSTVVSYLKNQGVETIDVMVCTHAHEDHVGGLSGPLNTCKVERVLSPVTEYTTKAFDDFVKYSEKQGLEIEIPSVGDTFTVGSAEVEVLGPVCEYEETHDTSIVLKV
nr:MBL fold metallo-hydrolase [Clostridia bacterium]